MALLLLLVVETKMFFSFFSAEKSEEVFIYPALNNSQQKFQKLFVSKLKCPFITHVFLLITFFGNAFLTLGIISLINLLYPKLRCSTSIFHRSSHQRYSVKKGVPRNSTKLTGKHLCQSLFFNKVAGVRSETLLKRDFDTGAFLWALGNFEEHHFYKTPLHNCFWLH